MALVAAVLAAGTIFEKEHGAEWTGEHFYGSWWFAVLLGLVAVGSLSRVYTLIRSKLIRSHFSSLLIHIAIPVILLGGALTSWTGEHYSITLAPGETKEGITLEHFEVLYYPGTHTPMDFVSHVTADGEPFDISMNHILRHDGRRYYQEDYDDQGRTTLSVSHDPWGIPVTYTGYALLLLGLGWLVIKRSERGVNKGSEREVKGTIASADNIADKNIRPPHSSFTPPSLPSHTLSLLLLLLIPLSSIAAADLRQGFHHQAHRQSHLRRPLLRAGPQRLPLLLQRLGAGARRGKPQTAERKQGAGRDAPLRPQSKTLPCGRQHWHSRLVRTKRRPADDRLRRRVHLHPQAPQLLPGTGRERRLCRPGAGLRKDKTLPRKTCCRRSPLSHEGHASTTPSPPAAGWRCSASPSASSASPTASGKRGVSSLTPLHFYISSFLPHSSYLSSSLDG